MIQRCQKLPFFEKAVTPSGTMAIEAKELDGNRLLNFTIRPLAEIDRAHAASPEQPDQTIWSTIMDVEAGYGFEYFFGSSGNTCGQVANFQRIETQEGFQFGPKLRGDLPLGHDALTRTGR